LVVRPELTYKSGKTVQTTRATSFRGLPNVNHDEEITMTNEDSKSNENKRGVSRRQFIKTAGVVGLAASVGQLAIFRPARAAQIVKRGLSITNYTSAAISSNGAGPTVWPSPLNLDFTRSHDASGLRWCEVMRTDSSGKWDQVYRWDAWDRMAAQLQALGKQIIFQLGDDTPTWASADPTDSRLVSGQANPWGVPGCIAEPANYADLGNWMTQVFTRYPKIIGWVEGWNEWPLNLATTMGNIFFTGTHSALNYHQDFIANKARLLKSGIPIISAVGLNGNTTENYAQQSLVGVIGAAGYDMVGVHFYYPATFGDHTGFPSTYRISLNLERLQSSFAAAGITKPIAITEMGWPADQDSNGNYTTPVNFSDYTVWEMDYLWQSSIDLFHQFSQSPSVFSIALMSHYDYDDVKFGFAGNTQALAAWNALGN